VLQVLATYGQAHGLQVKPQQAECFTGLELVNLLSGFLSDVVFGFAWTILLAVVS